LATSSVPRSDDLAGDFRPRPRVTKRGVAAVVALFAVTFVAAQSCQKEQIRIDQRQAVEIARPEAGFTPERTQVRIVRQGLNGKPFWAVSFSDETRITTVRIDANTGVIAAVNKER